MNKRFLITLLTLIVIGGAAAAAIYFAKGYRLSTQTGTVSGTGILSITSIPDQASVYLDDHLTTATNANVNSLPPQTYAVKIVKEGFIPWEKKVEVKAGLVSEVKATLFRAIPSVYPLTYSGVSKVMLSPDGQKLVFIQENSDKMNKKNGIWAWQMSQQQIAFARGGEPHQILQSLGFDLSQAKLRFSPDSNQLLVTLPDRQLLLETNKFNDPPKDITATVGPTVKTWDEDQKARDLTRLQLIKDFGLRKQASESALLKWSPDETRILYSKDGSPRSAPSASLRAGGAGSKDFQVADLVGKKSFAVPENLYYSWLPDSEHLVMAESLKDSSKISIIEFDGSNKSEIYAGNFNPEEVFAWPDSSRLVIISSLPIATASQPNLFGINLK